MSKTSSLSHRLTNDLRRDIISGAVEPGAWLKTEELAARYAVSANPVREALWRLQGEGFVVANPNQGARVRTIDDDFIRNVLKLHGDDADNFLTLQPLGDPDAMLAALQRNLIDGFIMSAPADQLAVQRGIGRPILDAFSGGLPDLDGVPFAGLATTKRQLAANPALFQAVVNAITKAIRYIHTNPVETRKLLRPYFADLDDKTFDTIITKYSRASATSSVVTRREFDAALRWANLDSPKTLSAPYSAVVDPSFAEKAMAAH